MSKYDNLWEYISKSNCESLKLTFDDITKIAGIKIDHSFLNYKKELHEYGYQVGKISLKNQSIIFHKISHNWKHESELFDQAAEVYDQYRPAYANEIIETIVKTANISMESKLLEIGSGSGKATIQFIPYNQNILCIDPGERLVKLGNDKFSQYVNVQFICGRFEESHLSSNEYDLIYSAQAFHWIPEPIGYEKCWEYLKDDGYLALIWNMYILNDSDTDQELLALSQKYGGFEDFVNIHDIDARKNKVISDINNSKLFKIVKTDFIQWQKEYTVDDYFGFLQTGNSIIKKTAEEKKEIYEDLKRYASTNGNLIKRTYICSLYLCQKIFNQ